MKEDDGHYSVTVTECPPGCGTGRCCRIFEDNLGMGYRIFCLCECHHHHNKNERAVVGAIDDSATAAGSHTITGLSEDGLPNG